MSEPLDELQDAPLSQKEARWKGFPELPASSGRVVAANPENALHPPTAPLSAAIAVGSPPAVDFCRTRTSGVRCLFPWNPSLVPPSSISRRTRRGEISPKGRAASFKGPKDTAPASCGVALRNATLLKRDRWGLVPKRRMIRFPCVSFVFLILQASEEIDHFPGQWLNSEYCKRSEEVGVGLLCHLSPYARRQVPVGLLHVAAPNLETLRLQECSAFIGDVATTQAQTKATLLNDAREFLMLADIGDCSGFQTLALLLRLEQGFVVCFG